MFDRAAYEVWKDHQRRVEVQFRDMGRFANMTDWAGKLPGATARLSGLMHCARWALECGNPVDRLIEEDTVSRAAQLGELLAGHALAVFDMMSSSCDLEEARKVWQFILASELTTFTFSELWHPLRGTFKRSETIEPAIEVLLDHDLILPADVQTKRRRGRRGRKFVVNPRARQLAAV